VDGTVSFSVTAANPSGDTVGLGYQWTKDGAALAGETNNVLNLAGLKVDRAGSYRVAVSNPFGSVTSSIATLTVNKAKPTISAAPTASAITYGQTLANSTLTGGNAGVAGSFSFTTPSTQPSAGNAEQDVTFTPTDTANYETVGIKVAVTVNAAPLTITGISIANKPFDGTKAATINGTAS
jgi:hypothetical protein